MDYEWHRAASRVRRLRVVLRVGGWNYPGRLLRVGTRIERLAASTEDSIVLIRYDLLARVRCAKVSRTRTFRTGSVDRSIPISKAVVYFSSSQISHGRSPLYLSTNYFTSLREWRDPGLGGAGVRPRSTTQQTLHRTDPARTHTCRSWGGVGSEGADHLAALK